MTSTGRRRISILDTAQKAVAAARVAVSSATRSASHSMKGQGMRICPDPPPN